MAVERHGDLWNSGKVATDQSIQVVLASWQTACLTDAMFLEVRAWDRDGRGRRHGAIRHRGRWTPATRRLAGPMGTFRQARYCGRQPLPFKPSDAAVSPWIRKMFLLEAEPKQGTAYVNTLGYHELYVNGQKVGADVLSPAVSDYRARSFYVTHDIAKRLRKGRNCVGLWLGRGGHGPVVRASRPRGPWCGFRRNRRRRTNR